MEENKIVAISDMHGNLSNLDFLDASIVIIAGDFSMMNGWGKWHLHDQKKWIEKKFFKFTDSFKNTQFIVIPGNHDLCLDKSKTNMYPDVDYKISWPSNVHLLLDSGIEINGLKFYGTPWIPIINYRWAFEAEEDKQKEMFSKIPYGLDFLVTHSPPHIPNSFIDRSIQYGVSEAFGSNALANEIFEKKPKHVICGHIHSGDHSDVLFNDSIINNVSRLNEDYNIAYEPKIIDVKH